MAQICRDLHMPDRTTIFDWAKADPEITQRIAHARELGFDRIAEDCLQIADDATSDYKATPTGKVLDAEHVQRSKLRIETRLKLLAKWDPKRYGDRQVIEHAGAVDIVGILSEARKRSGST